VGLAWLGFAAALLVAGYLLVGAGGVGPARLADLPVARFLAQHRPPLAVLLSNAAPLLLAPFVVLALVRLVRPLPTDVSRWRALGALGLAVAGAYGLVLVAKGTFARPRPPRALAAIADTGYSFPSAHVTVVAAACVAVVTTFPVGNLRRRAVWAACTATVVIAAVARLVLGVHWLTDVAVGAVLGSAWAACASWLTTRQSVRYPPAVVRTRQRRLVAGSSLAALLLLAPVGWSLGQALTFPGSAGWQSRSVDWARSNGGASIVDWVENFWYARTPPPAQAAPPTFRDPFGSWDAREPVIRAGGGPAPVAAPLPLVPHEASWDAGPVTRHGRPVLYTTSWRPDTAHTGVSVAAIWFDHRLTRPVVVAGTRQPGGSHWPWGAEIPPAQRARTVAVSNGGFRFADSLGGFYENGRIGRPLRAGGASLVVHADGRADVIAWPAHRRPDPSIVAVRQNLHLVVDHGRPVPGLTRNRQHRWGNARIQFQYTWRSGLGVDRRGNVIYLAGNHLDLRMLAQALAQAGCVRAMELDIHTGMVGAALFVPDPNATLRVDAHKLIKGMTRPATRYLQPDQRDFIAFVRA
jgi:membrane-associated phospholipid phosphatase